MSRLFDVVPWLEPLLYWLFAVTAVWLLASLPALVLHRTSTALRDAVARWADEMLAAVRRRRSARIQILAQQKARLLDDLAERPLDDAAHGQWLEDAAALRQPIVDATRAFTQARDRNDQAIAAVAAAGESLRRTSARLAAPEMPALTAAADTEGSRSGSLLTLWLSLGLLLPIVVVNAQLTALVLRAALPNIQGVFAWLPPAYAIAIVITLAEAGIGVAHGALAAEAAAARRQYTPGTILLSLLALAAVSMELLFYSQFSNTGNQPFVVPLFQISIDPGAAFGLLGMLLGSSVVILGRIVYSSSRAALQHGSLGRTRRRYESVFLALDGLRTAIEQRKAAVDDLRHLSTNLHDELRERKLLLATDEFSVRTMSFLSSPPGWATPVRRSLTASEAAAVESGAVLALSVALAGVAAMVLLGTLALMAIFPAMSPASAAALSLIPTAASFYAGFLFGQTRRARLGQGQTVTAGALILGIAAALGTGYLVGSLTGWTTQLMLAVGVIIAGALLGASGAAFAARPTLVLLNTRAAVVRVVYAGVLVLSALSYVLWALCAVVDAAFAVLAAPMSVVIQAFTRRRVVS